MAARTRTPAAAAAPRSAKPGLHPRNRHVHGYDFPRLLTVCPALRPFVSPNAYGNDSVDFADPEAVKALNRALLQDAYGIVGWDIPPGFLCPPVPGRADYLHHLADLLASCNGGFIPHRVRVLDIGVGANAIYPLLGHQEYGWRFLGVDTDAAALASAQRILAANPGLEADISLRLQRDGHWIFDGVVQAEDRFDLTLCNPPFHGSLREAREAAQQKWRQLGRGAAGAVRNFGGHGAELWCQGGEVGFVTRMIQESRGLAERVAWFTTLISSSAHLPAVQRALRQAEARDIRTLPMAQGQKQSRAVAWSFLGPDAMAAWALSRWQPPTLEDF